MVYWSAAAVALFYLLMTPVRLGAAYADARERPLRLGVLFWVFRLEIDLNRPRARPKKPPDVPRKALSKAAVLLLRGIRVERLHLEGTLHLQDAAGTALLCGALNAAFCALQAALPRLPLHVRVQPDFSAPRSRLRAGGILSVRAGHIIRAGTLFLMYLIAGRLHSWTNTRLKAS